PLAAFCPRCSLASVRAGWQDHGTGLARACRGQAGADTMGDGSGAGDGRMIRDGDQLTKTGAGRAGIANRSQKLTPALRSMLLLVDGRRDAAMLRKLGAGLHAPSDALEQLVALGLAESLTAGTVQEPVAGGTPSEVA